MYMNYKKNYHLFYLNIFEKSQSLADVPSVYKARGGYCYYFWFACLLVQSTFNPSGHATAHELQIETHDTLAILPTIGLAEIEIIAENPYQDFFLLSTQYGRLSKEILELRLASHMGSIAQEFSSREGINPFQLVSKV